MLSCYIGYLGLIFFIYSISYKKLNKITSKLKLNKLLKIHYIFGSICTLLAILHATINIKNLSVTFGTISLFFMICVFILGLSTKYSKGKKRTILLYLHIILSLFALLSIALHIIEYYIFSL